MSAQTNPLLSKEEVTFYEENGYYLYKKPLFSQEKQQELKQIFEEQWELVGRKLNSELDTPHFRDERLLKFLLSDEVLDLVEPLLGPNIALWSSHFICKEPFIGKQTPWHEDSAYWNGRLSRFDKLVTVWLAIDRSSEENGCMRVIPGTHNNGFSEYEAVDKDENIFATEIKKSMTRMPYTSSWRLVNARFTILGLCTAPSPTRVLTDVAVTRCVILPQMLNILKRRTHLISKFGWHAE